MKYLKSFNESISNESVLSDVLDLFQYYADDNNLDKSDSEDFGYFDIMPGYYGGRIALDSQVDIISISLIIKFGKRNDISKFKQDMESFQSQLYNEFNIIRLNIDIDEEYGYKSEYGSCLINIKIKID